jgi:hypothetical protein
MQVAVQFGLSSIPAGIGRQNDIGSPKTLTSSPAKMRGGGQPVRACADGSSLVHVWPPPLN